MGEHATYPKRMFCVVRMKCRDVCSVRDSVTACVSLLVFRSGVMSTVLRLDRRRKKDEFSLALKI